GVVYSNLGSDGQPYSLIGYSVTGGVQGDPGPPIGYGFAIALSFTPAGTFTLSSVELPLVWLEGPNAFAGYLTSDAGGRPGNILETFSLAPAPPFASPALTTLVSTARTPLDAGATYWIIAAPGDRTTAGYWLASDSGAAGFSRTQNDGVTWVRDTEASP